MQPRRLSKLEQQTDVQRLTSFMWQNKSSQNAFIYFMLRYSYTPNYSTIVFPSPRHERSHKRYSVIWEIRKIQKLPTALRGQGEREILIKL